MFIKSRILEFFIRRDMKFVATKFHAFRALVYSCRCMAIKPKHFHLFIEVFNPFIGVCTNASHMCALAGFTCWFSTPESENGENRRKEANRCEFPDNAMPSTGGVAHVWVKIRLRVTKSWRDFWLSKQIIRFRKQSILRHAKLEDNGTEIDKMFFRRRHAFWQYPKRDYSISSPEPCLGDMLLMLGEFISLAPWHQPAQGPLKSWYVSFRVWIRCFESYSRYWVFWFLSRDICCASSSWKDNKIMKKNSNVFLG